MRSLSSRQAFYLRLYDVLSHSPCRRTVSTTAAINKGLRASSGDGRDGRDRRGGQTRSLDGNASLRRGGGDRSKGYAERHQQQPTGIVGRLAPGDSGASRHGAQVRYSAAEEGRDVVWQDIYRVGELMQAIRSVEEHNPSSKPEALLSETRQAIERLNAAFGEKMQDMAERKRRMSKLLAQLYGLDGYVLASPDRSAPASRAEKTVVVEVKRRGFQSSFELVTRGEHMRVAVAKSEVGAAASLLTKEKADIYEQLQHDEGQSDVAVPQHSQQIKDDIRQICTLLNALRAAAAADTQQAHAPPRDVTAQIHRLLHSTGMFDPISQKEWRVDLGKVWSEIMNAEGGFFLRRRGEAGIGEAVVGILDNTEDASKRVEVWFDKKGVREPPSADVAVKTQAVVNGDWALKQRVRDQVSRVRELVGKLQNMEVSGEGADTASRDELAQQTRESLQQLNKTAEWSEEWQTFIARKFRDPVDAMKVYARREEQVDGSRSMIRWREGGMHELVLKPLTPGKEVGKPMREESLAVRVERNAHVAGGSASGMGKANQSDDCARRLGTQRRSPSEAGRDHMILSVPYTTAASEFLYGSNTVLAALRAQRRKLYHLYLSPGAYNRETGNAQQVVEVARKAGIRVDHNANVRLLDKMADNRPHNGVVLEASKLPAPPVLTLAKPDMRTSIIPLTLDRQTAEDVAVHGAPSAIPLSNNTWRHPLVVMLDGIVDPGNLGNILRTAHFYGADAVAISTNTCAPLSSAVLAKASSGACEVVRLLALPRPSNFVFESAKAGWRVFAAVAPAIPGQATPRDLSRQTTTTAVAASSPLAKGPCILMLGAEGEGLRANLTSKADHLLSIERGAKDGDGVDVGVDSLNVGVAAGVLMEAFLRKPGGVAAMQVVGGGDLGF